MRTFPVAESYGTGWRGWGRVEQAEAEIRVCVVGVSMEVRKVDDIVIA